MNDNFDPKGLATTFFELITAMPRLNLLEWLACADLDEALPFLREIVYRDPAAFSHVRELRLWAHANLCRKIPGLFIDLVTLHMPVDDMDKKPALRGLLSLKSLKHLSLTHIEGGDGWRLRDLQILFKAAPKLEYLILEGELGDTRVSVGLHTKPVFSSHLRS